MCKINGKPCAAANKVKHWEAIDFRKAKYLVKKLQRRIAKAYINSDNDKVVFLQHTLIHSFYAKALAVKIVTSNNGKYTCGTDNVLWLTPEEKFNAIFELKRRGYKPKSFKTAYISKSGRGKRKLSIPTIKDRAMQTLYKFALEPIAEITADESSFGFRPKRSTRDALIKCYGYLYNSKSTPWILEADIKSCFDNIRHKWIIDNVPIDKSALRKLIGNSCSDKGIPQGSCISSVICNLVLDGLEVALSTYNADLHFVRYADDFVVTSNDKVILINSLGVIETFLSERGLRLAKEKTKISHLSEGFDFLGWNICGDENHLRIIPSVQNVNSLLAKVEFIMCSHYCDDPYYTILRLFPVIDGWLNYHLGVVDQTALCEVKDKVSSVLRKCSAVDEFVAYIEALF